VNIELIAFWADRRPDLCDEFSFGHKILLKEYGIENVTSGKPTWKDQKNILVLAALNSIDKTMVGGARIHLSSDNSILPLDEALNYIEPNISGWLREKYTTGIGELCGLWNAKKVFGKGISPLLTRTSVAISDKLNIAYLVGLAAPYTKDMASSMGFKIVPELGANGTFQYPNERHTASLLIIDDIPSLKSASSEHRERIFSIRAGNTQFVKETINGSQLVVTYNLLV